MHPLLETISSLSTPIIGVMAGIHLFAFGLLWVWYRADSRRLAALLDDFTRGLKQRSVLDRSCSLLEQTDAFLHDIRDVLDNPASKDDREALRARIGVLDEKRRYLQSLRFETCYNLCRTMIETYPLAGILGTIIAIGAALQGGGEAASVQVIVQRFGEAIWSTCAGLVAAVLLLFLNGCLETAFVRLTEERDEVRRLVALAKRVLTPGGRSGS
jgi:biopolymer transport protein ExbB/TolQ